MAGSGGADASMAPRAAGAERRTLEGRSAGRASRKDEVTGGGSSRRAAARERALPAVPAIAAAAAGDHDADARRAAAGRSARLPGCGGAGRGDRRGAAALPGEAGRRRRLSASGRVRVRETGGVPAGGPGTARPQGRRGVPVVTGGSFPIVRGRAGPVVVSGGW